MKLFNQFGNKIEKRTILQTWIDCNQIYIETWLKLMEIFIFFMKYVLFKNKNEYKCEYCQQLNDRLKEDNELKILREMCLHILWNILKYPNEIKYRQINGQCLFNNLKLKCQQLGVNVNQTSNHFQSYLQALGFEKRNENWYYPNDDTQLAWSWEYYKEFINQQAMYIFNLSIKKNRYKIRYDIPKTVCMLKNGKWRNYEIVFDYQHRTIMLLNINGKNKKKDKLKLEILQVGDPKKLSLEFNVTVEWHNDFDDIDNICAKWACLTLNHTWHFCTIDHMDRDNLSNCFSEFNSFQIIWRDRYNQTRKESFNPYAVTLEQGIKYLKYKYQMLEHFIYGMNELVYFEFEFDKCQPQLTSNMTHKDASLHDIYKHVSHYPIIQVYWNVTALFMVPYEQTIDAKRAHLPTVVYANDGYKLSVFNKKPIFNPFLYECDLHKLKIIEDILHLKITRNNSLKKLLHEVIKNNHLSSLITYRHVNNKQEKKRRYKKIKQQINYNKDNPNKLILNDKILTILNEVKILYHDGIHKHMGYPLQLENICAILLYCGKPCNVQFSYDQIQFRHHNWPYLDHYLQQAIAVLHKHERREESETELYSGLKGVRLENIKEIKEGFFISYLSTSDNIQVAQMYRSDQGCILHFHPSMRRTGGIKSCDVSWISPYKHEREILFARSFAGYTLDGRVYKELLAWNAKIESEDEYTQMILLTWTRYDEYVQQTMQISAMWNYSIDFNLIYVSLKHSEGDIYRTINLLLEFEVWKLKDNNNQKYEEIANKFVKRRCCNHSLNMFYMFLFKNNIEQAIEYATICAVANGFPFVGRGKY
ncbi:hypothetical protein RFI_07913 [Reticulomyxa filosa]|uniref:Uncharacterized protein n=1 Tax=Reticulomyxa filosa TaxID=46433 RepID=X6NSE6_RETFI|nr:hypothetical protein RFI_07913 [Reticulomyxa filosa]|eukprot:ETO29215.1 hypothetical protein RFI_07913 [Reticulomyxa filosa]